MISPSTSTLSPGLSWIFQTLPAISDFTLTTAMSCRSPGNPRALSATARAKARAACRDNFRSAGYIATMGTPTVDNATHVLILQHPQEQDRVLGTAKLLTGTLAAVTLTVGLSWRNLAHAL